jgi:hypothetical protein
MLSVGSLSKFHQGLKETGYIESENVAIVCGTSNVASMKYSSSSSAALSRSSAAKSHRGTSACCAAS